VARSLITERQPRPEMLAALSDLVTR
jgi:hypothetical protein